jgi:hypothetical protein
MLLTAKSASGFELRVDKSGHTEGVTVERMASSQAQGEAFELTGRYSQGNRITLSGLSNQIWVYTVSADDMRRDTSGKTGEARDAQIRNNIANRLRILINGAPGSKVFATGDADIILLGARAIGSAGAFKPGVSVSSSSGGGFDALSQRASATGTSASE